MNDCAPKLYFTDSVFSLFVGFGRAYRLKERLQKCTCIFEKFLV